VEHILQNGSGQRYAHNEDSRSELVEATYSWVEHCDWMPALLSGNTNPLTMKRADVLRP